MFNKMFLDLIFRHGMVPVINKPTRATNKISYSKRQ